MTKKEEEKLIKKAVRGNVEAYGKLIEINKEYLYRTAYIYTRNEEDSLDLVSECILKGFRSIKKLKEPSYFKTWLTRILINSIRSYQEKQGSLDFMDLSAEAGGDLEEGGDYGKFQSVSAENSVNLTGKGNKDGGISLEEKMDLCQAVGCLSEKYKTVIVLKYFSELKISEISEVMGIPEGSVSAYLTRAKKELRNYLREDYCTM